MRRAPSGLSDRACGMREYHDDPSCATMCGTYGFLRIHQVELAGVSVTVSRSVVQAKLSQNYRPSFSTRWIVVRPATSWCPGANHEPDFYRGAKHEAPNFAIISFPD
jgi:hypothetical protein